MIGTRGRAGINIAEVLERELRAHYPEATPEDINEAVNFGTRVLESMQIGPIETSPCVEGVNAVHTAALARISEIPSMKVRFAEVAGQKALQLACLKLCTTADFSFASQGR